MICPKCHHKIRIRAGKGMKIRGVWRHKACTAVKKAAKKPAA